MAAWAVALWTVVINQALKSAFAVPRPMCFTVFVFGEWPGYSFPSGHTMGVAIAAGTLAFILAHELRLSSHAAG